MRHLPEGQDACVPEQGLALGVAPLTVTPSHSLEDFFVSILEISGSLELEFLVSTVVILHQETWSWFKNKLEAEIHPIHYRLLMPLNTQTNKQRRGSPGWLVTDPAHPWEIVWLLHNENGEDFVEGT